MKASADRWIAAADDLHVSAERSARVDVAADVDRRRDLEIGMEQIDGGGGGEQLHVRCRSQRQMRVALGDDASRVDLNHRHAGLGIARSRAIQQRREPLLERVADGHLRRRRGRCSPSRPAPPFRRLRGQNESHQQEKNEKLPHRSAQLQVFHHRGDGGDGDLFVPFVPSVVNHNR